MPSGSVHSTSHSHLCVSVYILRPLSVLAHCGKDAFFVRITFVEFQKRVHRCHKVSLIVVVNVFNAVNFRTINLVCCGGI